MISSIVRMSLLGTQETNSALSADLENLRYLSDQICGCVSNITTHKSLINHTNWTCHAICSSKMIPTAKNPVFKLLPQLLWFSDGKARSIMLPANSGQLVHFTTYCMHFQKLTHGSQMVLFGSLCKQAQKQTS